MSNARLISILFTATIGSNFIVGCAGTPVGRHPNDADATGLASPASAADDAKLAEARHPISHVCDNDLGAGGGFLIGASPAKLATDKAQAKADAVKASQRAERNPAKPDAVDRAPTADLNNDGYVTLDEVVAMRQANVNDQQIVERLQQTGQLFELTEYQQDYLRTRGVSDAVIHQIPTLNTPLGTARAASE